MANNDQVLLDQIVEDQHIARLPTASKSDFFEQYVAEQVLKDYDLSDEEVEYGLTGGGRDGGIDGIYTFANGELVRGTSINPHKLFAFAGLRFFPA